jgi:hypothetical protein
MRIHQRLLEEAGAKLAEAHAELALCEARNKEQRDAMYDLLCLMGTRKTCSSCGIPVFWIRHCGDGVAYMYNPDGTQHWPRCKGTERPALAAAGGSHG